MNDEANTNNHVGDAHDNESAAELVDSETGDVDDDTEGSCFKYRDGQPPSRPDDTQGHILNSGNVYPAGDDDRSKRGPENPG
jgi:hypothetical protein